MAACNWAILHSCTRCIQQKCIIFQLTVEFIFNVGECRHFIHLGFCFIFISTPLAFCQEPPSEILKYDYRSATGGSPIVFLPYFSCAVGETSGMYPKLNLLKWANKIPCKWCTSQMPSIPGCCLRWGVHIEGLIQKDATPLRWSYFSFALTQWGWVTHIRVVK